VPESVPPQLLDLRARVEQFFAATIADLVVTAADEIPRDVQGAVRERSRAAGLFNLAQPREFGGQQIGVLARVVLFEALAAANSPLGRFVLGPSPGVIGRATGPLREAYLEPVLRGEKRGAFAFTEPSGPEASARPTWARREGETLVINGRKAFVTGGATADFYTALVNVDPAGEEPGGPAMVVIDRDAPGVSIDRRFASLDGGHHVSLRFEDARVPATSVIGRVGEGMQRALGGINEERIEIAATACGLAVWATRHVAAHITAAHPSGQRLGDREGVRLRYSDLQIETYVARSVLYRTARLLEAGEDALNEVMATKVFCSEALGRIVDTAVQLEGGQALVAGHPLEALYRRVRSMRLAGGASDVLRLNIARGRIEFGAGRL